MLHIFSCLFYILFVFSALVIAYAVSGLTKLVISQWFSHLGELNCPPVPSFFWGHLQLLHDAENTNLYMKWREQMGSVFTYKGFVGGRRLVTMDTRAITHILSQPHMYPKPSFVRDTLASMAGEHGLLVVEGDVHKRQRKILNPSFTASQVRELAPIFYDKAIKLRDIWLEHVESAPHRQTQTLRATRSLAYWPTINNILSPATPILPLAPPPRSRSGSPPPTLGSRPRALFRQLGASALAPEQPFHRRRYVTDHNEHHSDAPCPTILEKDLRSDPSSTYIPTIRIDVLNWLGRATLDVIGLAGFGYAFDSLIDDRNVLATAFAEIFSAARTFRFTIVLQAWFPILRYFHANRNLTDRSLKTMHQIGMDLIHTAQERLASSGEALSDFDFRAQDEQVRVTRDGVEMDKMLRDGMRIEHDLYHGSTVKGRDLLSLLVKSNMATKDKERMSEDEILSQISTFMAAGHETTSSALTWTLYALSQNPDCQSRLRVEIAAVDTQTPSPETLNELPYLDMVVRESLRLYSPVSQTMRVATRDDTIPVARPYRDAKGRFREVIVIKKGDIISIPIQAMNKCKFVFGENAEKFIPERWERPPDANAMPALYSSILTFLYGGRACIGYRFALLEMKVFLFVLIRSVCFEMCPDVIIEKRLNVVTRPVVKSEPERGNQMPLLLSRVHVASSPLTPPLA